MSDALRWLGLLLMLASASVARAEDGAPPKPAAPPYWLSARIGASIGFSRALVGTRAGVSGEYWFSQAMGVGLFGALVAEDGLVGNADARGVGLSAAFRSADHGHYFYFGIGAGYARVKHVDSPAFCFEDNCVVHKLRYHGVQVSSVFGWLAHPRGSHGEIGPVVRFDVLADPKARVLADFSVTFGAELGFVL